MAFTLAEMRAPEGFEQRGGIIQLLFKRTSLWHCNSQLGRGQRQKEGDQEKMTVARTRGIAREVLRSNQFLAIEIN